MPSGERCCSRNPLKSRFAASGMVRAPSRILIIRPSAYTQIRLFRVITWNSNTPVVGLLGAAPSGGSPTNPTRNTVGSSVSRPAPPAARAPAPPPSAPAAGGPCTGGTASHASERRDGRQHHGDNAAVAAVCGGGRGASPP